MASSVEAGLQPRRLYRKSEILPESRIREMLMLRTTPLALVALVCSSACAQPTPEQTFVNDIAAALGGRDRIAAVKTLTIEGEGTQGNLGQDMTPEATGQAFNVTGFKRSIDIANGRERTELTRTPNFTYFQGPQPQTLIQGLDGEVGYNVAPNGTATRTSAAAANDRRMGFYHHPLGIARLALDSGTKITNIRTEVGRRVADLSAANGLTFTLAIDATTFQPVSVASKTSNPNLGDVTVETTFADYQNVNGVMLPARLTTKVDDFRTAEYRLAKQTLDGDAGDLTAPPAAASAAPQAPPTPTVTAEEVAKGIWWLAGQSHHSALVEFGDHLMLIEAPQSEARTLAVIAKAKELRPNKPLTQVVTSHHHFDHSAGVRAAIAEGATVITHASNRAFFEMLGKRPFTIQPDTLAKSPKPTTIEAVGAELVVKDAGMAVVLYPIEGNPHGEGLLMAYFPKEGILVQADVFSPGGPYQPYAANLLENVQKRKLRVDRIVPLHGTIVPFSDLVKAAAAATN
jgi:glyoxylase-like metal-dependent hydrolase (beta-lactamase superfamily II)